MKCQHSGCSMKVLDLGCGSGKPLAFQGVLSSDEVVGLDLDFESIRLAKSRYPDRTFVCGRGEDLRFLEAHSFDRVVCNVALPYMNIPQALPQIHRVLRPGGRLWASVHTWYFTASELKNSRFQMKPTAFRTFVFLNGAYFHLTGRVLSIAGKCESTQTRRGMTRALERAGFRDVHCEFLQQEHRRLIVEATKAA
jgi:ubiquinone/menaquinone biosynthesis C-methylase UbiE